MRKLYPKISLVIAFLSISATLVKAQEDGNPSDISINELLNLKATEEGSDLQKMLNENVTASSKKALSSRETPGIVSVITQEEIKNLGARDLVDILKQVPGIDFATDVEFVVGIGLRGNWANEGKVLLMVDGQDYNEILYQTIVFGNKFPVDQIEKIEIIRGPGSSIYGGTAEYGVINIITKGGAGFQGITATSSYGMLPHTYGRRNIGATFGNKIANDLYLDISMFTSQAIKSDQEYQDLYLENEPVNLTKFSNTNATNANVGVTYKNTKIRAIYDKYENFNPHFRVDFNNFYLSAQHAFRINRKILITPAIFYTQQVPWEYTILSTGENEYKVKASRFRTNVTASYDINRKLNLVAGSEVFFDRAQSAIDDDNFGEETYHVNYHNASFFAQGLLKHYFANFTFGFRFDRHNIFGNAFVPRLAITKRFNQFHFKALYSQSYRAPGIENINLNEDILPERSHITELELGYQFTPEMILAVNAYKINTNDVIIYSYTDLDNGDYLEEYANFSKSGTSGMEVVYKIRKENWNANLNYSFYQANKNNTVATYAVAENPKLYVAFPGQKFSANASYQIIPGLRLNPSVIYQTERFGYNSINEEEIPVLSRFAPYTLFNLFINYDLPVAHGLTVGVGVYDLLNEKEPVLQAYNGDYAPVSGRSREFLAKISYQIPFDSEK